MIARSVIDNNPNSEKFMCAIDEYATIRFKSACEIAITAAKMTLIKQRHVASGMSNSELALLNTGKK